MKSIQVLVKKLKDLTCRDSDHTLSIKTIKRKTSQLFSSQKLTKIQHNNKFNGA